MQANASFHRALFYQDASRIVSAQYQDSDVAFIIEGKRIELQQRIDSCTGEIIRIEEVNRKVTERPRYLQVRIQITSEEAKRLRTGRKVAMVDQRSYDGQN